MRNCCIVVDDMRNSEFEKQQGCCCCKIRIGNESGTVLSENLRTPSDCCLNVADLDYSETGVRYSSCEFACHLMVNH